MAKPKFFRFPFAATGDKEAIPDEAQSSGLLSYSEGFGLDYERDPTTDAKAKRMPRDGTNQVLYDTTSNLQQYQLYGIPFWYDATSNGGTAVAYQKNAMVRYSDGTDENIYISLKDNNTDTPTVEASWFLFQPYNSTLLSRLSVAPFVPVESMTLTTPPTSPITGKLYLVPVNATGDWTGKSGQLAEWDGTSWKFIQPQDGHGIGLPDGKVFIRVKGVYQPFDLEGYRVPLAQLNRAPFVPVTANGTTTPPTKPVIGDAYIIGQAATGVWAGHDGQLAEWTEKGWMFTVTPQGHVIGLPDGTLLTKGTDGYQPQLARGVQSGKWLYAEAGGTENELTATLNPKPLALTTGMKIRLGLKAANTAAATLNVDGLGAKPIVYHETGSALVGGDFQAGDVVDLIYDGSSWRIDPTIAYFDKRYSRLVLPPTDTFFVDSLAGNDGNNGFTPSTPFKTLQGAVDAIIRRYITTGTINLNVAAGDYEGFTIKPSLVQNWVVSGVKDDPSKVVISAPNEFQNGGYAFQNSGSNVTFEYVELGGYTITLMNSGGLTLFKNSNLRGPVSGNYIVNVASGSFNANGQIKISGDCTAVFFVGGGGTIRLGGYPFIGENAVTITFSGIRAQTAVMLATTLGVISVFPQNATLIGMPTGRRFAARLNGIISVNGAGVNFIPGTVAGDVASGGQYG